MQAIRHIYRRKRRKLSLFGWYLAGVLLIFCVLTVQLSATEGRSSRRSDSNNLERALPTPAQPEQQTRGSSTLPLTDNASRLASVHIDTSAFQSPNLDVGSRVARSPASRPSGFQAGHPQLQMIVDHATAPNVSWPQPATDQQYNAHEPAYGSAQAMPYSNYFGVDPNQCCDEWSGFCDCEQKMFSNRCRKCDKSGRQIAR